MSGPEMTPGEMAVWAMEFVYRRAHNGLDSDEAMAEAGQAVLDLRKVEISDGPYADMLRQVRGEGRLHDETPGAMPFDSGAGS